MVELRDQLSALAYAVAKLENAVGWLATSIMLLVAVLVLHWAGVL